MNKRRGVLLDVEGEGGGEHQVCSFMWAYNLWIISHSKKHLEQMLKDLIEEAAKVDLEPKPASLCETLGRPRAIPARYEVGRSV